MPFKMTVSENIIRDHGNTDSLASSMSALPLFAVNVPISQNARVDIYKA